MTNEPLLRVMVDANVLISGSVWPRFPYEVLRHAQKQDFRLVLSSFVIMEARRHLERDFPDNAWRLSEALTASECEIVPDPPKEEVFAHQNLLRDLTDVPIALAAINSGVDYFVTQDRDFTDRDEGNQILHEKLNIVLPGTFLREKMGWTSEALEVIRTRKWEDFKPL